MAPVAVSEFHDALAALSARSGEAATRLVSRLDRLSPAEARQFVTDAYPELITPFMRSSGDLATQWYAEQPAPPVPRGGNVFVPEAAPLPPADQLAISGRWALSTNDPVTAIKGTSTRRVWNQARKSMISNAIREGVGWVRVAQPDACGFCKMLATRQGSTGAGTPGLYASQKSALLVVGRERRDTRNNVIRGHTGLVRGSRELDEPFHDHCQCDAIAVRTGVYEPPAYVEAWQDQYDAAVKQYGLDPNAIARALDNPARRRKAVAAAAAAAGVGGVVVGAGIKIAQEVNGLRPADVVANAAQAAGVAGVKAADAVGDAMDEALRKLLDWTGQAPPEDDDDARRLDSAPELILFGAADVLDKPLPNITEPSDDSTVEYEVDSAWMSNGFDTIKWDIRDGADQAIAEGYAGPPADLVGWKLTGYLRSKEGRATLGAELVARAVHSEPTEKALWRGMQLTPEDLEAIKPGESMTMKLSSFTPNYSDAKQYAKPDDFRWISGDVPEDGVPVILKLEAGAKVAALTEDRQRNPQREHVAFGRFEVVDVKPGVESGSPAEVTIRQVSLDSTDIPLAGDRYEAGSVPLANALKVDGKPSLANLPKKNEDRLFLEDSMAKRIGLAALINREAGEVNPNWLPKHLAGGDDTWRNNCARCVVAWELRRRGYDVEASPAPGGLGIASSDLANMWRRGSENGNFASWRTVSTHSVRTMKEQADSYLLNNQPDGARGFVAIGYKQSEGGGGHVFAWERVGDKIVYAEPQVPKEYQNQYRAEMNFDRASPVLDLKFMRTDDLFAGPAVAELVLPAGGADSNRKSYPAIGVIEDAVEWLKANAPGGFLDNGKKVEWTKEGVRRWWQQLDGHETQIGQRWLKEQQAGGALKGQQTGLDALPRMKEPAGDVASLRRESDKVNPNWTPDADANGDDAYRSNCFMATIAYELRRRGYDVEAKANDGTLSNADGDLRRLFSVPNERGPLPAGFTPVTAYPGEPKRAVDAWVENIWEPGQRGFVGIEYEDGGGHVFVVENVNGKAVYLDPQVPEERLDGSVEDVFKLSRGEPVIMRTDHLIASDEVADYVLPAGDLKGGVEAEFDPMKVTDALRNDFYEWLDTVPEDQLPEDYDENNPLSNWRVIEQFLADKYPAAHRGFANGKEDAAHWLDQDLDPEEWTPSMQNEDDWPDLYSSEDADKLGYDPQEVAAGMVLLHNRAHSGRGGGDLENDKARLVDIYRKRVAMQRAADKRAGDDLILEGSKADKPKQRVEDYEYAVLSRPTGESAAFRDKQLAGTLKKHQYPDEVDIKLYHGSRQDFAPGELVEPGMPGNFVRRMKHVYASDAPEKSHQYGGKVYEIRPLGPIGHRADAREKDGYYASEWPFEVVRQVPVDEYRPAGDDLILTGSKLDGGGPGSAPVVGEFGKVASRLPEGTEIKPIYKRNRDGSIRYSPIPKAKKNVVRMYHRTTEANVAKIHDDAAFLSKEGDEVFFSTKLDGQAEGYGPGVVIVDVPKRMFDKYGDFKGDGYLSDEFPSGEKHWSISRGSINPDWIVTPEPVVDVQATWASVSDETLDENLRQALRQAQPWAVEAGTTWYPGVRKMATRLTKHYAKSFKEQHGVELSPDILGGLISVFSRNNGWIRNAVGVRQYLDDPFAESPKRDKKTGEIKMVKPMHVDMKGGAEDLIEFVKERHAAGETDDHAIVEAFFASFPTAPKPHRFWRSIMGDEDNSAIDRWMARVQLHTDDPEFAEKMRSATRTVKGVKDNYGYHRLEASIKRISREPEFAGFTATQLQAMPWVHLVGPEGVLGDIQDLSSDAAASAEARRHTEAMGWKDPV